MLRCAALVAEGVHRTESIHGTAGTIHRTQSIHGTESETKTPQSLSQSNP
jgi:hypothetical protein